MGLPWVYVGSILGLRWVTSLPISGRCLLIFAESLTKRKSQQFFSDEIIDFLILGLPQPEVLCTSAWWDGILRFCDSEIVNFCTLHFAHLLRVKDDCFPRAARKCFQTVLLSNNFLIASLKRRAQRENFSTLHLALGTWHLAAGPQILQLCTLLQ